MNISKVSSSISAAATASAAVAEKAKPTERVPTSSSSSVNFNTINIKRSSSSSIDDGTINADDGNRKKLKTDIYICTQSSSSGGGSGSGGGLSAKRAVEVLQQQQQQQSTVTIHTKQTQLQQQQILKLDDSSSLSSLKDRSSDTKNAEQIIVCNFNTTNLKDSPDEEYILYTPSTVTTPTSCVSSTSKNSNAIILATTTTEQHVDIGKIESPLKHHNFSSATLVSNSNMTTNFIKKDAAGGASIIAIETTNANDTLDSVLSAGGVKADELDYVILPATTDIVDMNSQQQQQQQLIKATSITIAQSPQQQQQKHKSSAIAGGGVTQTAFQRFSNTIQGNTTVAAVTTTPSTAPSHSSHSQPSSSSNHPTILSCVSIQPTSIKQGQQVMVNAKKLSEVTQTTAKVSIGNTTISVPLLKPLNKTQLMTAGGVVGSSSGAGNMIMSTVGSGGDKQVQSSVATAVVNSGQMNFSKLLNVKRGQKNQPTILSLSGLQIKPATSTKIVTAKVVSKKMSLQFQQQQIQQQQQNLHQIQTSGVGSVGIGSVVTISSTSSNANQSYVTESDPNTSTSVAKANEQQQQQLSAAVGRLTGNKITYNENIQKILLNKSKSVDISISTTSSAAAANNPQQQQVSSSASSDDYQSANNLIVKTIDNNNKAATTTISCPSTINIIKQNSISSQAIQTPAPVAGSIVTMVQTSAGGDTPASASAIGSSTSTSGLSVSTLLGEVKPICINSSTGGNLSNRSILSIPKNISLLLAKSSAVTQNKPKSLPSSSSQATALTTTSTTIAATTTTSSSAAGAILGTTAIGAIVSGDHLIKDNKSHQQQQLQQHKINVNVSRSQNTLNITSVNVSATTAPTPTPPPPPPPSSTSIVVTSTVPPQSQPAPATTATQSITMTSSSPHVQSTIFINKGTKISSASNNHNQGNETNLYAHEQHMEQHQQQKQQQQQQSSIHNKQIKIDKDTAKTSESAIVNKAQSETKVSAATAILLNTEKPSISLHESSDQHKHQHHHQHQQQGITTTTTANEKRVYYSNTQTGLSVMSATTSTTGSLSANIAPPPPTSSSTTTQTKCDDSHNVLLKQLLQNSNSTHNLNQISITSSSSGSLSKGSAIGQQQQLTTPSPVISSASTVTISGGGATTTGAPLCGGQVLSARKVINVRAPSLGLVSSLEAQLARPVIPPVPANSSNSNNNNNNSNITTSTSAGGIATITTTTTMIPKQSITTTQHHQQQQQQQQQHHHQTNITVSSTGLAVPPPPPPPPITSSASSSLVTQTTLSEKIKELNNAKQKSNNGSMVTSQEPTFGSATSISNSTASVSPPSSSLATVSPSPSSAATTSTNPANKNILQQETKMKHAVQIISKETSFISSPNLKTTTLNLDTTGTTGMPPTTTNIIDINSSGVGGGVIGTPTPTPPPANTLSASLSSEIQQNQQQHQHHHLSQSSSTSKITITSIKIPKEHRTTTNTSIANKEYDNQKHYDLPLTDLDKSNLVNNNDKPTTTTTTTKTGHWQINDNNADDISNFGNNNSSGGNGSSNLKTNVINFMSNNHHQQNHHHQQQQQQQQQHMNIQSNSGQSLNTSTSSSSSSTLSASSVGAAGPISGNISNQMLATTNAYVDYNVKKSDEKVLITSRSATPHSMTGQQQQQQQHHHHQHHHQQQQQHDNMLMMDTMNQQNVRLTKQLSHDSTIHQQQQHQQPQHLHQQQQLQVQHQHQQQHHQGVMHMMTAPSNDSKMATTINHSQAGPSIPQQPTSQLQSQLTTTASTSAIATTLASSSGETVRKKRKRENQKPRRPNVNNLKDIPASMQATIGGSVHGGGNVSVSGGGGNAATILNAATAMTSSVNSVQQQQQQQQHHHHHPNPNNGSSNTPNATANSNINIGVGGGMSTTSTPVNHSPAIPTTTTANANISSSSSLPSSSKKRMQRSKSSKIEEDYDSFTEKLMSHIRQMQPLQVLEPLLNRNFLVSSGIGGSSSSSSGVSGNSSGGSGNKIVNSRGGCSKNSNHHSSSGNNNSNEFEEFDQLQGDFGEIRHPYIKGYYDSDNSDNEQVSEVKSSSCIQNDYYDQEFSTHQQINTREYLSRQLTVLKECNSELTDLIENDNVNNNNNHHHNNSNNNNSNLVNSNNNSSSSSNSNNNNNSTVIGTICDDKRFAITREGQINWNLAIPRLMTFPGLVVTNTDCRPLGRMSPLVQHIEPEHIQAQQRLRPLITPNITHDHHYHNRGGANSNNNSFSDMRVSSGGGVGGYAHHKNQNVILSLNSSTSDNIAGVLRDLANLLHISPTLSCKILESDKSSKHFIDVRSANIPSLSHLQKLLNGKRKLCRHCAKPIEAFGIRILKHSLGRIKRDDGTTTRSPSSSASSSKSSSSTTTTTTGLRGDQQIVKMEVITTPGAATTGTGTTTNMEIDQKTTNTNATTSTIPYKTTFPFSTTPYYYFCSRLCCKQHVVKDDKIQQQQQQHTNNNNNNDSGDSSSGADGISGKDLNKVIKTEDENPPLSPTTTSPSQSIHKNKINNNDIINEFKSDTEIKVENDDIIMEDLEQKQQQQEQQEQQQEQKQEQKQTDSSMSSASSSSYRQSIIKIFSANCFAETPLSESANNTNDASDENVIKTENGVVSDNTEKTSNSNNNNNTFWETDINITADDGRQCVFCSQRGDGQSDGPSRLLNFDVDKWVHLNCALWSNGVYETISGGLMNFPAALQAGLYQTCSSCHQVGATVKCFKTRCGALYHLPCAVKEDCVFYKNKTIHCQQHASTNDKDSELTSLVVHRRVYVERDENRQVATVMHYSELSNLLRVGNLTFLNVGQLLPHQLEAFHTPNYIYPIGYKVSRYYWCMRRVAKRCRYICSIGEVSSRPEFRIHVHDNSVGGVGDQEFRDTTPTGVWLKILTKIANLRKDHKLLQLFPQHITGEELFGLTEPAIVRILESLPGIETLTDYRFKYGRNPLLEFPLAINPSGAARTEPKQRQLLVWRKPHTQRTASTSTHQRMANSAVVAGEVACPYSKQFVHSKSSQYKKMKQEWRNNVYLARSKIQGLGLYAARDIEKHTMIIEYIGEVIRTEVSELREKQYEAKNRGIYMFRLDEDRVVDATLSGGLARYINHSCNPNCVTEIVEVDRDVRIIIFAKRKIYRGEELSYDYKFDIEDESHKIPCACGAPNCRKWMN